MKTNLLPRALNQRTPVKLKKQKPMFTKAEIYDLLLIIYFKEQELSKIKYYGNINKNLASIRKKLNNQLKEMI